MKVAIYARVSSEEQREKDSIQSQLFYLRKYCEDRKYTIVEEYCDNGFSGRTESKRAAYNKMVKDANRRRFDAILTFKLDRLHRNVLNAILFINNMANIGVDLIITDQNIDTTTPIGKAMTYITAIFAQLESEQTSQRSKIGTERAKAQGKVCHRPEIALTPYQINKAREILTADPDISMRALATQFDGISRPTLIKGLRKAGVLPENSQGGAQ